MCIRTGTNTYVDDCGLVKTSTMGSNNLRRLPSHVLCEATIGMNAYMQYCFVEIESYEVQIL